MCIHKISMESDTSNDSGLSEEVTNILRQFPEGSSERSGSHLPDSWSKSSDRKSCLNTRQERSLSDHENYSIMQNYSGLRRKIERQKRLIVHLQDEHGLVIARLRDEFEGKLENITKLHQDLLASNQQVADERASTLSNQLGVTKFELESVKVISHRLSSDYSEALSNMKSLKAENEEMRAYISQLENRLREFHVPLPRGPDDSDGYQLLSALQLRWSKKS